MGKLLKTLLTAALFILPTTVSADFIGTYKMDVNASSPTWSGYYADYDVETNPLGGTTEVFCVEGSANMNGSNSYYDFFKINSDLEVYKDGNDVSGTWLGYLTEASWYANWFVTQSVGKTASQIDQYKKIAQAAVWHAIGFLSPSSSDTDKPIRDLIGAYDGASAESKGAYASKWRFAVSPGTPYASAPGQINIGEYGQNYLVAVHAPEPATMMLLGFGLIGIAGIGRKKLG